MTQSFATQEFDALDGFDLDDDFIDAAPRPLDGPAFDARPEAPERVVEALDPMMIEAPALDDDEAFNPVGRLVETAETAAAAVLPAAAVAAPTPAPAPILAPAPVLLDAGLPVAAGESVEVSIPRIAVHVFAERQDTLAAAERAGQDRRMSRATTQIRVGGVAAAIEAYQSEPTPPLIVVECLKDPQTLLWEIDQLAEVCDAGTKVVVIGATNDILLFRELMRRGVSEYLVAPLQPLQLIAAIGGLFADPAQPFVGRSIAFVGARGGAGASAVAHNTAYAMSERIGVNTVIVDYDLPFGTAGLDFNQDPLGGVADALSQPDRLDATLLDRMMVRCTDKLSLFAAPASLDADWDIQPDAFEEVTSRIRSTAPFVVLDLPHLWSGWMRKTLISADEVVIVATPDLASLRNAKNMIDLIKQGRPNDAPPRLVLNQVGVPGRPEIPAKDFGAALGVHPSLIIPFDAKIFGSAANNGQMIVDAGAKSKAAEAFQTLAQIVSRRELPVAAAPRGKAEGASSKGVSLFAGLLKKKR
ncbi:MAG: AAA family ATPase [Candidatus Brevundimonas phytovorans]|nr:AAA family ATPase [Brevundimonas sp.]WEK57557.1 MAG: AAA family ATPase [Brevundimonas sp.]